MKTGDVEVYRALTYMKRRVLAMAGVRHGPVFQRLLEDLVDLLGEQLAECRAENRVLESKLDTHVSTLRSDISKLRQEIRSLRGQESAK